MVRDTEYNTPIEAIVIIKEVFPLDMSGSGNPVGGIVPLTTSAFITTCIPYTSVMPEESRNPNLFLHCLAILNPR